MLLSEGDQKKSKKLSWHTNGPQALPHKKVLVENYSRRRLSRGSPAAHFYRWQQRYIYAMWIPFSLLFSRETDGVFTKKKILIV